MRLQIRPIAETVFVGERTLSIGQFALLLTLQSFGLPLEIFQIWMLR